jgi:hypothetical protein
VLSSKSRATDGAAQIKHGNFEAGYAHVVRHDIDACPIIMGKGLRTLSQTNTVSTQTTLSRDEMRETKHDIDAVSEYGGQ